MNMKELQKLITQGESDTVEFKEIPNDNFFRTLSAFANTRGGMVILGIGSKGDTKGIDSSNQFLEDITNRIVNKLSFYPEIETIHTEHKKVLSFKVNRTTYPVSYDGRYYERVGNTTREMSREKLRAILLTGKSWDSITGDFSITEIDAETIRHFVQLAVDSKRLTGISLNDDPEIVLKKLGLIIDGKLTNGAVLLFGKDPQKHFINLCVRIGRFKTATTIIDDKWARGNLFNQFEETINIIRQQISVRYVIKGFERKDIWDYPLEAVREAVLNTLAHRDYFNVANFTTIKVYDDRIWFYNFGRLPNGITVEDLKMPGHESHLRNPLIAKVLYLAGYIEQYGSGTVRMVEWMKEANLPEPEYKEEMGGFSVYFYKDIYTDENLRKMGLNDRQIKAVLYVKERGDITNKEYQQICGISARTATRDLADLVSRGIFEQVGITGKGTSYKLRCHKDAKEATKTP